jgi:hypothetical protein
VKGGRIGDQTVVYWVDTIYIVSYVDTLTLIIRAGLDLCEALSYERYTAFITFF